MTKSHVIHGDAREVLRALDLEGAVVITDPPWPSGATTDIVGAGKAAHDLWREVASLLARARAVIVYQSALDPPFPGPPGMPFVRLCWIRIIPTPYRGNHLLGHIAQVFGSPPRPPAKSMWPGECVANSRNIFRWRERTSHPCPMPLDAARWLVRWWGYGCRIVDPFCGAGTVLRAAAECGQPAIGIECDERWIQEAEMALRIGSSQGRLDFGDHAEPEQISLHGEET